MPRYIQILFVPIKIIVLEFGNFDLSASAFY